MMESYVEGLIHERRYLLHNPSNATIASQRAYVRYVDESESDAICGLFMDSELVGTSGIQNIAENSVVTFGIFVFQSKNRNRGLGKTLVWATSYLLSNAYGIERCEAGMEKSNLASLNSFLSCGFKMVRNNGKNHWVALDTENLHQPEFITNVQIY